MKIRYVIPALAAVAALALTGCVNNAESEGAGSSSPADTSGIQADSAAVALLPDEVKKSGEMRIGTDAEYPPNEFKDASGNPVGWGVDLASAVSAKLGLTPKWEIMGFDNIIPVSYTHLDVYKRQLVAVTALALTGCTNDDSAVKESSSNSASVVSAEEIMKSGVLIIGTDAEYPPNEFKDADGNPTGWGVELANAVAEEMGLEPEWQIMPFEGILPRIEEGAINMGSSSFTDNAERQKTVDFVNFLDAGSMWAAPVGSNVNPDDACGLTIAVQADTCLLYTSRCV